MARITPDQTSTDHQPAELSDNAPRPRSVASPQAGTTSTPILTRYHTTGRESRVILTSQTAYATPAPPQPRRTLTAAAPAPVPVPAITARQVAILVEDGVHHTSLVELVVALTEAGALVHLVGPRVGTYLSDTGAQLQTNASIEDASRAGYDAAVMPDGHAAVDALATSTATMAFVHGMFQTSKPLLALGYGRHLLHRAGIKPTLLDHDGILFAESSDAAAVAWGFLNAVTAQRDAARRNDRCFQAVT